MPKPSGIVILVAKLMTPEQLAKAEQLAAKWRAANPAP